MISRKIKVSFVLFAGILSALVPLIPQNAHASFFIGGETVARFRYRCCGADPTNFGFVMRIKLSEQTTGGLERVFPALMWQGVTIGCVAPKMVFMGIGINKRIGRIRVVVPIFGICMPKF